MKRRSKNRRCKALALVLALPAASACGGLLVHDETPTNTDETPANTNEAPADTGEVDLRLTFPDGTLSAISLNFTLANGTPADTLTGSIPIPALPKSASGTPAVMTYEIANVPVATGFEVTLTSSADASVSCTGTIPSSAIGSAQSPQFSVTAGNETVVDLVVTCAEAPLTGCGIEVSATIQSCAIVQRLTASPSTANTTAPGKTSTIEAMATGPDQEAVTYSFETNGGTLSGQTNATGGLSSSTTFTCPPVAGTYTVTVTTADMANPLSLYCSDPSPCSIGNATCALSTSTTTTTCGDGGTCVRPMDECPRTSAASTQVTCLSSVSPCNGIGTGVPATPDTDAGTCPPGQVNTGTLIDSLGNFCCEQPG